MKNLASKRPSCKYKMDLLRINGPESIGFAENSGKYMINESWNVKIRRGQPLWEDKC